jgi:SPP1 family predicted phage head-tail adaptor
MNSGELMHEISIQTQSTTRGDAGELVDSWTTDATIWASIKPGSGREFYNAKQINAEITHEIKLWYYPGLSPAKRFLFRTRVFNILQVKNVDEGSVEMVVYAKEIV